MKAYLNTVKAIRDYMAWLESQDKLRFEELERIQLRAGHSNNEILSAEMLRLFHKGKIKSFAAERAEAFCRAVGIQLTIISPAIPETFVAPTKDE